MHWVYYMASILEYFQIVRFNLLSWKKFKIPIELTSIVHGFRSSQVFWKYKDTHNASIAQVIEEIKDTGLGDINDLYRLGFSMWPDLWTAILKRVAK